MDKAAKEKEKQDYIINRKAEVERTEMNFLISKLETMQENFQRREIRHDLLLGIVCC